MKINKGQSILLAVMVLILGASGACKASIDKSDVRNLSWAEIEAKAKGTTVTWAMWGGDDRINTWVDTVVATRLKKDYGVDLLRIPMDASVFVSKVSNEKSANKEQGSLDLLWINGENFRRAKSEGLLLGPISDKLPNMALVNPQDVVYDFGTLVEGYEVPYGRAQFVFEYDSAKIPSPPRNFVELKAWIIAHPGRFTYPEASDFTGSAFIRQVFYASSGGQANYIKPFDQDEFAVDSAPLWAWLKDVRPYLWQKGTTYPSDKAKLDTLFERGEVDFNMSYSQGGAQGLIHAGRYPATVRTLVMERQSLGNIHYTAVPFNSPNPAGALKGTILLTGEILRFWIQASLRVKIRQALKA